MQSRAMRRCSIAREPITSRERELRMKLLTTLAAAGAVCLTLMPGDANAQRRGYYWVGGYAVPGAVYRTYAYRPAYRYRAYRPYVYAAAWSPYYAYAYYPAYSYAYYPTAYAYPVTYAYASCGWGWC
jgi:hypothetical protein